jgi:light-regulated signal transduction histidine kinase (bacteriophytochrome)
MRELVSKACRMPVSEVQGQTRAEANHVYVVPPRCNLGIFDGVLHAQPLPDISQNSNQNRAAQDIENLCQALEAKTRRSLEAQRRLDRANAEFEAFISTAAHNLREHLRDVTSFTQLMAETYAGRLGSEADLFLERIQEGAEAMQSVLTHIVDYWATGTGDRQFSEIDMEGVLRQAILCTDQEITQRGAVVTHDPLPRVCGDFGALIKVLHHLIRNAVEYCATPAPRIHISSRRIEPNWVISVQDNGPGIDPAFHERIFEAFKRLHGKEHPGTGLGLAFCKKTLEWHGGRMWMESTPGAGSTFYFSLPPAD